MERLTKRYVGGQAYVSLSHLSRMGENECVGLPVTKLARYEDAEEQGLLLRLPCKVGDTVYVKLASYCDLPHAEAEVRDFTHFTSCGFCVVVTSKHFDKQSIPFTEFGKTVFLTQEEAEQALEEMKGGSDA